MEENREIFEYEPAQQKKKKDPKVIAIAVLASLLCLVLLAGLVYFVMVGSKNGGKVDDTTAQTTAPAAPDVQPSKTYTVDDETAHLNSGAVIATAGDMELTNGEMMIYYNMFLTQNSYSLYYYGVDLSKPMDQQWYDQANNLTWQQAIVEESLNKWHAYAAVYQHALAQGFQPDEEAQNYMNSIDGMLQEALQELEYRSVEEMLDKEMGAGSTLQGYKNFMVIPYLANLYVEEFKEQCQPTMDEIEQYFAENEAALTAAGVSKESGHVIDVRHVLITPEGGTVEGNTTVYSEDEWEACRQKAEDLLNTWLAGDKTEESFAELANKESTDPGSNTNGGLYENVTKDYMVPEFDAWIFDESRVYGDYGLVKTSYGYHIMYFVERNPSWIHTVSETIAEQRLNTMLQEAVEKYDLTVYDERICLGDITKTEEQ